MLFDDTYRTIAAPSEGLFSDRGSKFIAFLQPLNDETELRGVLAEIKAIHPKARHFCWAYRLSPDRQVFRVNDDGEPSGTAGRPILNTLLSHDLTNVILVVVRYFGGTLLGVPGLINAYKTAAAQAVSNATIEERTIDSVYELKFPHAAMNEVMRIVKDENIKITDTQYDENYALTLKFRQTAANRITERLDKVPGLTYKFIESA